MVKRNMRRAGQDGLFGAIEQVGAEHWRILREELDMMIALGRRR